MRLTLRNIKRLQGVLESPCVGRAEA